MHKIRSSSAGMVWPVVENSISLSTKMIKFSTLLNGLQERKAMHLLSKVRGGCRMLHCPVPSARCSQALTQPNPFQEKESIRSAVDPLKHPDFFHVYNLFTVRDLFDARVHYGHKEGSLDSRMKPFIFGSRLGHLIFDLDITARHLRQALNFAAHTAFEGGVILFVQRGAASAHMVERTAQECKEFANTRLWRGGIFTNANAIFGAVTRLPDLCIFINTLNDVLAQHTGITEAAKMAIPTIGIVDTNCNPNLITYPVPGNDDSLCAIELYLRLFKEAILRGKEARKKVVGLEHVHDT